MFCEDGIEREHGWLLTTKVYFNNLRKTCENTKRFWQTPVSAMQRTGIPNARDPNPLVSYPQLLLKIQRRRWKTAERPY